MEDAYHRRWERFKDNIEELSASTPLSLEALVEMRAELDELIRQADHDRTTAAKSRQLVREAALRKIPK